MSRRSKQLARDRRASASARTGLPAWTPFVRSTPIALSDAKIAHLAQISGQSEDTIRGHIAADLIGATFWENSRYFVIRKIEDRHDGLGTSWHLSIRRQDRQPVGEEHFRDFQRIKNELLGPDAYAFEIYPSEDNLADTSNQYHLHAFDDLRALPFGYRGRAVIDAGNGLVQRPLEEGYATPNFPSDLDLSPADDPAGRATEGGRVEHQP